MDGTNIRKISLSSFKKENTTEQVASDKKSIIYKFDKTGGKITVSDKKGTLCGYSVKNDCFVVLDITNRGKYAVALTWGFYEENRAGYIGFKMGLLPNLRTRIALPLSILDGSTLFLPRTPGKLKTVTQGSPIKLSELSEFELAVYDNPDEVELEIHDIYLSDTEPDYPVEKKPMIDVLGQKNGADWKGKTKSEKEMIDFLNKEYNLDYTSSPDRSIYGGWLKKQFEPSGFFAIHHDGKRFWLVDPQGYAFFSIGLDCIDVDGGCNITNIECLTSGMPDKSNAGWIQEHGVPETFSWHRANLQKAFGENWYNKWVDMTKKRLVDWNFNTVACWSDPKYIERADQPFVFIFDEYPTTDVNIFRDFPDVFSKEFSDKANAWAKQLEKYKDNPYLIGYFMSNEPKWAFVYDLNIAKMLLESDKNLESKDEFVCFMQKKYDSIAALNSSWQTDFTDFNQLKNSYSGAYTKSAEDDLWEFSAEMIREFIKVPALAAKAVDKNHLNLGIRYAWISSKIIVSGSEYCDAFSFNCYTIDPTDSINEALQFTDKPLIIGEYHFGALDRGLDATGIRAVSSQEQRGVAYRKYMHAAAAHPSCIGAHYFTLNDQAYLGRFDGENYQIGLVDVCNKPYYEFVDAVKKTNGELYDIADGNMKPTTDEAEIIAPIYF